MDRRPRRCSIVVLAALAAVAMFSASAQAQLLGGKGGKSSGCGKSGCEECTCTPYLLNIFRGQHGCCGCGCSQCGYYNWCGHGKPLGWSLQNGILPRSPRSRQWWNYYYGNRGGCGAACGSCCGCGGSGNDLFYNYYAPQTGAGGGVPAEMYTAPHDTPRPAIQTYYTYQPWLPHEMLYEHNRSYTQFHDGCYGMTHTTVSYGGSPIIRHFDD